MTHTLLVSRLRSVIGFLLLSCVTVPAAYLLSAGNMAAAAVVAAIHVCGAAGMLLVLRRQAKSLEPSEPQVIRVYTSLAEALEGIRRQSYGFEPWVLDQGAFALDCTYSDFAQPGLTENSRVLPLARKYANEYQILLAAVQRVEQAHPTRVRWSPAGTHFQVENNTEGAE